jgi:hypothetical protein
MPMNPKKPEAKTKKKVAAKPKAPAKPAKKAAPKPKKYMDATDRPGFLFGRGTI